MAFLDPRERTVLNAVACLANGNPFLEERVAAEQQVLGDAFVETGAAVWYADAGSGSSSPNVARLHEHFEDLVDARMEEGFARDNAEKMALRALGDLQNVGAAMREQADLKSWAWRHPRMALVVYPLACLAALPVVPVRAGYDNAGTIARWAACLVVSGLLTAMLFLVLQLSIRPQL